MSCRFFIIFAFFCLCAEGLRNETKIIIIGAGPAAIAAGSKLLEYGFSNVTVLEGQNRIGGRVFTTPFGAHVVDMGGEWCHGQKGNVVYEIVEKMGLLESSVIRPETFVNMKSNGERLDPHIHERLDNLTKEVESLEDEMNSFNGSMGRFLELKLEEMRKANYSDIDQKTIQSFLNLYEKQVNGYDALDSWYNLSASNELHYEDPEGDLLLHWKDKGYKIFLDILMHKYPNASHDNGLERLILFNKTVTKINWNEDKDGQIQVFCSDGSVYSADHVLSTVSLGVLKNSHTTLFDPPLPDYKKVAIENIGFGVVNKIYLEFSSPFWDSDFKGANLFWNTEDLEEIRQRNDSWIQGVIGFYTVDVQPNLLCGWISGENARQMEKYSDSEVLESSMYLLRRFLKNASDPVGIKRSSWYSNPYFRGSYSYWSVNQDIVSGTPEQLAEPLLGASDKPRVLFAGEATSSHHFSTVNGATETGWREAMRIIRLYSENS